jgi:hypothetical protein
MVQAPLGIPGRLFLTLLCISDVDQSPIRITQLAENSLLRSGSALQLFEPLLDSSQARLEVVETLVQVGGVPRHRDSLPR